MDSETLVANPRRGQDPILPDNISDIPDLEDISDFSDISDISDISSVGTHESEINGSSSEGVTDGETLEANPGREQDLPMGHREEHFEHGPIFSDDMSNISDISSVGTHETEISGPSAEESMDSETLEANPRMG